MNTFDGGLVDLDFKIAQIDTYSRCTCENWGKKFEQILFRDCGGTVHKSYFKVPYMANIGCVIQKMP